MVRELRAAGLTEEGLSERSRSEPLKCHDIQICIYSAEVRSKIEKHCQKVSPAL